MKTTLNQRVDDAIDTSPHVQRRHFSIQEKEGRVTIAGRVPTFFQKQMVQETVMRVEGVETIDNQLEVTW